MRTSTIWSLLAAAALAVLVAAPAQAIDHFVLVLGGEGGSIAIEIGSDGWGCAPPPPPPAHRIRVEGCPVRHGHGWFERPARVEHRTTVVRQTTVVRETRVAGRPRVAGGRADAGWSGEREGRGNGHACGHDRGRGNGHDNVRGSGWKARKASW